MVSLLIVIAILTGTHRDWVRVAAGILGIIAIGLAPLIYRRR
jgi:hypothetical protein